MKRYIALLIAIILLINTMCLCSCKETKKTWTEKDFYFYNKNGNEIVLPTISNRIITLSDYETAKTYRDAKIGDKAITVLTQYLEEGCATIQYKLNVIEYNKDVNLNDLITECALEQNRIVIHILIAEKDNYYFPVSYAETESIMYGGTIPTGIYYWFIIYIEDEIITNICIEKTTY